MVDEDSALSILIARQVFITWRCTIWLPTNQSLYPVRCGDWSEWRKSLRLYHCGEEVDHDVRRHRMLPSIFLCWIPTRCAAAAQLRDSECCMGDPMGSIEALVCFSLPRKPATSTVLFLLLLVFLPCRSVPRASYHIVAGVICGRD